jgi:hypothetical protein
MSSNRQTDAEVGPRQTIKKVAIEAQVAAGPRHTAILIGRRFDRDYLIDLRALGQAIKAKERSVIHMLAVADVQLTN